MTKLALINNKLILKSKSYKSLHIQMLFNMTFLLSKFIFK